VSSFSLQMVLVPTALALLALVAFLVYVLIKYTPLICGIFEQKPMFVPLRRPEEPGGEEVRFPTADGLMLAGTYFPARTVERAGVLVFCHEYLSDRWSYQPYLDPLRDRGYDIFTFDFRDHGDSPSDPSYRPLHWVSDRDLRDLRAALDYLRSRPDRDPAGVGLFGISRGGGAALCLAADDPSVWGVITDGAFPTHLMMIHFMYQWAERYVSLGSFYKILPYWMYAFVAWASQARSERRLGCRFPSIEQAAARLSPRPWLLIHGEEDSYIEPNIARALFDRARAPKDLWIVPGAKHNRCREADPDAYAAKLVAFLRQYGPRRPLDPPAESLEPSRDAGRAAMVAEAPAPAAAKAAKVLG
jgi:pimeloyl-ACP methyl ester carboxylesterase